MSAGKTRRVVGAGLALLSAIILIWGYWPVPMVMHTIRISPAEMQLAKVEPVQADTAQSGVDTIRSIVAHSDNYWLSARDLAGSDAPVLLDARDLVTEWPTVVRAGDSAPVRMSFQPVETALRASSVKNSSGDGHRVIGPESPLAQSQQVVAQSRLELSGMESRPAGVLSEALVTGKQVRFAWNVWSPNTGVYTGTLWLHLQYVPHTGGRELRKVISAQAFEIEVKSCLGLSGNSARILGTIGLVLGAMMWLDIITLISKRLFSDSTDFPTQHS